MSYHCRPNSECEGVHGGLLQMHIRRLYLRVCLILHLQDRRGLGSTEASADKSSVAADASTLLLLTRIGKAIYRTVSPVRGSGNPGNLTGLRTRGL